MAISASEFQRDGGYSETFHDFEEKLARANLRDVDILLPPLIWDVTYWDRCIWGGSSVRRKPSEFMRFSSRILPSSTRTSIPCYETVTANGVTVPLTCWLFGLTITTEVVFLSHLMRTFIGQRRRKRLSS